MQHIGVFRSSFNSDFSPFLDLTLFKVGISKHQLLEGRTRFVNLLHLTVRVRGGVSSQVPSGPEDSTL